LRLVKLRLTLATIALLAVVLPVAAQAAGKRKITVMTRNVFLGADLAPAIGASSIPQAIDGAGVIWNELQSTRFRDRAVPLARELKRSKADLIGLQEVALWRKQVPSDGGAPPISPVAGATAATDVDTDFLKILKRELRDAGARYKVAAVQREFEAELPVDVDGSDATGTGPLAAFGADFDARLTMRDVILKRKRSGLRLKKVRKAHFDTRYEPNVGGVVIPVDRGWVSVEAKAGHRRFRFVDTHLEAFGDPSIRTAQADELIDGPLDTGRQVILVGDLNSGTTRHNEPERPGDDGAFLALAGFGMKDRGAIQSCCYDSLFDPAAIFDHTVDHVLTKPGLKLRSAEVTGDDASERTSSGLWPSDHGGVISRLKLRR